MKNKIKSTMEPFISLEEVVSKTKQNKIAQNQSWWVFVESAVIWWCRIALFRVSLTDEALTTAMFLS